VKETIDYLSRHNEDPERLIREWKFGENLVLKLEGEKLWLFVAYGQVAVCGQTAGLFLVGQNLDVGSRILESFPFASLNLFLNLRLI
jgi:hypothetical protein